MLSLCILTLSSINSIFAQDSTNFIVNTNVIWSGMTTSVPIDPSRWAHSYYIRFREDTIVDNKLYTKVWVSEDSLATDWRLRGLIKEENKKVFYRRLDYAEDLLQYDFSLKKNDTLTVKYADYNMPIKMKVENVDTVSVNGIMRKRMNLVDLYDQVRDTWIEKIGSMKGILKSCFYAAGGIPYLLCVYEDNIRIYNNSKYNECFYTTRSFINSAKALDMAQMEVFPNPFNHRFTINSNAQLKSLEVFDALGFGIFKRVYSSSCFVDDILLENSPEGLYLLKVTTRDCQTKVCKIQKIN